MPSHQHRLHSTIPRHRTSPTPPQQQQQQQQQQIQSTPSSLTPSQQREIAIFWDYENVPLPEQCINVAVAAKAIVDAVSNYGRIVDRRLYYDFEKMNRYRPRDCGGLDSSGFDLVNTPSRNQKETLDKKLIADVLTFAWDSAVRNDHCKPCVVLLTSDGDYAYTISKLRDRGIMTIVMVGRDCTVASILVDTADVALSLEADVLQFEGRRSTTTGSTNTAPSYSSSKMVHFSTTRDISSSKGGGDLDQILWTLCDTLQEHALASSDGWIDAGSVAVPLQSQIRKTNYSGDVKERARAVRDEAYRRGLLEIGRRHMRSKNYAGPRQIVAAYNKEPHLSLEIYLRLLPEGQQLLEAGRSGSLRGRSLHDRLQQDNGVGTTDEDQNWILHICQIVQERTVTSDDGWWDLGSVLAALQGIIRQSWKATDINETIKEHAKAVRETAERQGFIRTGRRVLKKYGPREIVSSNDRSLNLSGELYVCLLSKGKQLILKNTGTSGSVVSDETSITNKSSGALFLKNLPVGVKVLDIVGRLEETLNVIVVRAKLTTANSPQAPFCHGHFEFVSPDDADKVLCQCSSSQGLYIDGRKIGGGPDRRPQALNIKGHHSVYYEKTTVGLQTSGLRSNAPNGEQDTLEDDDTANDVACFCLSIDTEPRKYNDVWVSGADAGMRFRTLIRAADPKTRFRDARQKAVEEGLIEMGRKRVDTNDDSPGIVTVAFNSKMTPGKLSLELYFRLLSPGAALAKEHSLYSDKLSTTEKESQSTTSSEALHGIQDRRVFLRNLPASTKAKTLADFLQTSLQSPVKRIEMEENAFKGTTSRDAHVELFNADDAVKIIQKGKRSELIYCGRHLYACGDRQSPEDISRDRGSDPELSYTSEEVHPSHTSESVDMHEGPGSPSNGSHENGPQTFFNSQIAFPERNFDDAVSIRSGLSNPDFSFTGPVRHQGHEDSPVVREADAESLGGNASGLQSTNPVLSSSLKNEDLGNDLKCANYGLQTPGLEGVRSGDFCGDSKNASQEMKAPSPVATAESVKSSDLSVDSKNEGQDPHTDHGPKYLTHLLGSSFEESLDPTYPDDLTSFAFGGAPQQSLGVNGHGRVDDNVRSAGGFSNDTQLFW